MDLLYVDYEPERVCKLCLQLFDKKENLTSLLSDPTVVSLINTTLDMEVELNDGTPTGLCSDCLLLIKRYDWMKRRSHKANTLSTKFIAIKKGYNGSDYPEKSPFAVATTSSDMYLLEHVIDEDITEEDQSFDSIKIEDTFSLDTPGNVRIPLDLTFIKEEPQTEEDKLTPLVVTESVASHFKPKTVQKCRLCRTIFINQWTLNKHHAYCCQRFKCLECTKCFFDRRLFRLHKLRRQSCVSADVFRYCVICNITFRWRWQLTFHIFNHK